MGVGVKECQIRSMTYIMDGPFAVISIVSSLENLPMCNFDAPTKFTFILARLKVKREQNCGEVVV